MPVNYRNYPDNWKTGIRPKILDRAGNRCEFCGIKNKSFGFRDSEGVFHALDRVQMRRFEEQDEPPKIIQIVLTVAHLDHDVTNNDLMEHGGPALPRPESNLRALCQKCHLNYDAEHHQRNAAATRQRKAMERRKLVSETQLELGI